MKSVPEGQKWCNGCKTAYPATSEYFYPDKSKKTGLSSRCRECRKADMERRRKEDPENAKAINRRCYAKHQERRVEEKRLERAANPEKVREINKRSYAKHRERRREGERAYRKNNPEKVNARNQRWREQNPEKYREMTLRWREANADKLRENWRRWRKENPEKCRAYEKKWKTNNYHKVRQMDRTRRARELGAEGVFTEEDAQFQRAQQKNKCYWCGCALAEARADYHADHRIPLTRGGTNWPNNIVVSCPPCNQSKSDKLPSEWNGRLL